MLSTDHSNSIGPFAQTFRFLSHSARFAAIPQVEGDRLLPVGGIPATFDDYHFAFVDLVREVDVGVFGLN